MKLDDWEEALNQLTWRRKNSFDWIRFQKNIDMIKQGSKRPVTAPITPRPLRTTVRDMFELGYGMKEIGKLGIPVGPDSKLTDRQLWGVVKDLPPDIQQEIVDNLEPKQSCAKQRRRRRSTSRSKKRRRKTKKNTRRR